VRLQRDQGKAALYAEKLKTQYGDAVGVGTLNWLEAPAQSAVEPTVKSRHAVERRRPLVMGTSVGHVNGAPGTLGAFVETAGADALLSASHVLAPSKAAEKDDAIHQPGREGGQMRGADRIGALSDYASFSINGANEFDAAIATLADGIEHDGNRIPDFAAGSARGKSLTGVEEIEDLERKVVAKVGRTTGYTRGVIGATAVNDVTVFIAGRNYRFDNLVEIQWESEQSPFSQPGDSGSVAFIEASRRAFGVVFAGGLLTRDGKRHGVSYVCDLQAVLAQFGATLLT
jgi:hypothetical protein